MKSILAFALFYSLNSFAQQQQKTGLIYDRETGAPVEFADVYDAFDLTYSNADGRYLLVAASDSVTFKKIGYESQTLAISSIPDTVYLNPRLFELEEVVLTNLKTLWDRVGDSLRANYTLSSYKERFFIRCLLRKNGELIRVQDVAGKLKRRTLFYNKEMEIEKKDFEFEVEHMRKLGIEKDENDVYFRFFSLSQLFLESVRLNATGPGFEITERSFEGEPMAKIFFQSDPSAPRINTNGHYLINKANNAIESVVIHSEIDSDRYYKNGPIRSRTVKRDQVVHFHESTETGKYYLNLAKLRFDIEITSTKKDFKDLYTCEYTIQTYDNGQNLVVKPNANAKKDLFKLKFPFEQAFWERQHFLPLTNEIEAFIEAMGKANKTFKIRSNLK